MMKRVIKYIIAILLESELIYNKEQSRLEMHYNFNQKDIMKDTESYFTTENDCQSTPPCERLIYSN